MAKKENALQELKTQTVFHQMEGAEIVNARDPYTKHFDLGGGKRQAIVFAEPVHYREDGQSEYSEIDNTLESVQIEGRSVLRNAKSPIRAEFSQNVDARALVQLTHKGRTLSWRFEGGVDGVRAQVEDGAALMREQLLKRAANIKEKMASLAANRAASMDAEAIGGESVAFSALMKADSIEKLSTEQLDQAVRTPAERRADMTYKSARLAYENILPGVSANYMLEGACIKEDIVVENAQALASVALILCDDFDYRVEEDQSVKVCDSETGAEIYTFAPPLVYDATDKREIAAVKIARNAEGVRMTYAISDSFLQEAGFPVTIDPVVRVPSGEGIVDDTYIWVGTKGKNYGNVGLMRSGHGESGESISLVKFKKLPAQRASDTIISVQFAVVPFDYASTNEYMACYEIKKPWSEMGATWNNMTPDNTNYISDEVISYITSTAYDPCYFDITDVCRKWYKKDDAGNTRNFGVAIRYPKGVSGKNQYVEWHTADATHNYPRLYVNYVSHAGIESWWQYEQMSAGRAGTANVDIYNGNMVYAHPDVSMNGNRMPVSVAHYYNSCLSESNADYCGMGWRTTANQSLHYRSLSGSNYYIWTDGDGTEHHFKKSGSAPYKDEEGMELKLTISSSVATIKDKGDTAMAFPVPSDETKVYIRSVSDASGNKMSYVYSTQFAGRVDKLIDGVGRETVFSYNAQNLLSQILSPDGRYVHFTYDGENRLVSIGYSDLSAEEVTEFTYDGNLLVTARNYDGLTTALSFEDAASYDAAAIENFAQQARRVISMEQFNGAAKGAKKLIAYLGMTTRITAVKDAQTDAGKTITYQFNDAGNVVCMFDELGFAQSATYSASLANTLTASSKLQKAVINLATNVAFDADWEAVKGAQADIAVNDAGARCLSMPSVKIEKNAAGETLFRQVAPIFKTGAYTFSAYVKATDLIGGGAFVRLKAGEAVYESLKVTKSTENSSCGPNADGWERVQLTAQLEVAQESENVTLEVVNAAQSGTAYFACPQLETGTIANRVNLLANGDFSRTIIDTANSSVSRLFPDDWAKQSGIGKEVENGIVFGTDAQMPQVLSGNAVRIRSYPGTGNSFFQQNIPLKGSAGDAYVLGGWVNALAVQSGWTTMNLNPCMLVLFKTVSGWESAQYKNFSKEHVGWQFGCWAASAPKDYTEVAVGFEYARNAQTAMFSNLFLHREQFGQSFAYDDDKTFLARRTWPKRNRA